MVQAAIVTKWQFVMSGSKKFQSYIDYVDRDEATRNNAFSRYNVLNTDGYNYYMEDPEKSSGLFTANKDSLTKDERQKVKELFRKAQKNDSLMWQDVVSFDTNWLVETGLYDAEQDVLNEAKIMKAIRIAMKEQLNAEGLKNSGIWTAAIHYNEKHHIHVHIAIVEPEPTRPYHTYHRKDGSTYEARKGFREKKNVERFKSQVMSQLLDRDEPLARISSLIRSQLVQHKGSMNQLPDARLHLLYQKIYTQLPPDRRQWKYNMNALDLVRPLIDQFTTEYLATYQKEGYHELKEQLNENVNFYQRLYGEGTKEFQRANDFKTNKLAELYANLGNGLLKEMSAQYQNEHGVTTKNHSVNWNQVVTNQKAQASKQCSNVNLSKVKKALQKDFESIKNQQEYMRNIRNQEEQDQGLSR